MSDNGENLSISSVRSEGDGNWGWPSHLVLTLSNDDGDEIEARIEVSQWLKLDQKEAKPNPEGFTDLHKQVCEGRCGQNGESPCYRLPEMVEPCEHITPCAECQAEVEMLVDALDRHG